MQKHNDNLLVSKLKEGNKSAFEQLYGKYSAKLYNSVSLLLNDKNLAKDITQSCFLTIWEKRDLLNPEKSFSAYLYTIARNLVYKETERLILRNKFVESSLKNLNPLEDDTTEDLNNSYIEEHINKLIKDLPQIPQKVFLLRKEENLSNKEIADRLDITERSVEAHIYRTIRYLKEKLRDYITIFLF
ncbi:MAG: RNA polymerase sigma-70 factor [Dysgonomonas sp.]|nr:RNA polymerase sigma-70 factor [Dysgonomonas sp.]